MIQQAFNGMITLLLAKFLLNDVPHAVSVTGNDVRTSMYRWEMHWQELVDKIKAKTGCNIEEMFLRGSLPAAKYKLLGAKPAEVKQLLSWYYALATLGPSSPLYDNAVDRAFSSARHIWGVAKPRAVSFFKEEIEEEPHREPALTIRQIDTLLNKAVVSRERTDKVEFIDAYVHETHEAGMAITLGWPAGFMNEASEAVLLILGELLEGEPE